jgi:hypothetical protein
MSERSENPMIQIPGSEPSAQGNTSTCEQRKSVRVPFTATAEILDISSHARVMGRLADLSSGGCYIDTISPLAAGAAVRVSLTRDAEEFTAKAIVKYALPSMGMGLTFTEIKPEHQAVLQKWISGQSGEREAEREEVPMSLDTGEIDALVNLRQAVSDLIHLMLRKKALNEDEAASLMRQIFR